MKNDVDVCVYLIDDHVPAAGTADGIGAGLLPFSLHGSQIFNKNNNTCLRERWLGGPSSDEMTDTGTLQVYSICTLWLQILLILSALVLGHIYTW
jgi:hypothetical protein